MTPDEHRRDEQTFIPMRVRSAPPGAPSPSVRRRFDAFASMVAVLDRDGTVVQANAAWRRFIGSRGWDGPSAGIGASYLSIFEAVLSPAGEGFADGLRRVLSGGSPVFEAEAPCDTEAGRRWFRVLVTPWSGEGGDGVLVTHLDSTAEAGTRGRVMRLHGLLLGCTAVSRAIVRAAGIRELLESACRALVGRGGVRLARAEWRPPEPGEAARVAGWGQDEACREALEVFDAATEHASRESGEQPSRARRPDYGRCPELSDARTHVHAARAGLRARASLPLERDGAPAGMLVVWAGDGDAFDPEAQSLLEVVAASLSVALTGRERAERWQATLRELNEYRSRITEAERIARLGSWELTVPERTLRCSREVYRIYGYDPDHFAGGLEALTRRIHPEDLAALAQWNERVQAGERDLTHDHRIVLPDGDVRHLRQRATLVERGRLVGTVQDVTDHKRVERQMLRAERLETMATLANGVGHDLNNALSPILLSLEMLKSSGLDETPVREALASIEASALRGAEVVRQLLSFGPGAEGGHVEVQLKHLIRDVEKIARNTFPRNLRIDVRVPARLWPVKGESSQLHHVLVSLCLNARDAMPGGGTLTMTAENVTLDEQEAAGDGEPGHWICVRVADDGHGIPAELHERIFDPFFSTRERGGSGLGLSTALAVVRHHGGFIRLRSAPGAGTEFRVYLPAALGAGRSPAPGAPAVAGGRGECVLVVDDEPAIREVTRRTLERHGYRVRLAGDGAEALVVFSQHRAEIAVVLTDMMMPIVDGTALVMALRRASPDLRIVVMSGLGIERHRTAAAEAGVSRFLDKPFTAAALLGAVRAALDDASRGA